MIIGFPERRVMGTRVRRMAATATLLAAAVGGIAVAAPADAATVHAGTVRVPNNTFACSAWGYGATLAEAKEEAREMWVGNRVVGYPVTAQGQYADGSWWYEIYGDCYVQM
jgi:hypothetical protein